MNKKLFNLFFALALIVGLFSPAFSQSDSGEGGQSTGSTTIAPGSTNRRDDRQRNRLDPLTQRHDADLGKREGRFNSESAEADSTLGTDRVLFLTSAALGIPVDTLRQDFTNSGFSIANFIMSEIVARAANVPVSTVIDQFRQGLTFNEIASNFNTNRGLIVFRMNSFINTFADEIDTFNGTIQPNAQQQNRILARSLRRLDRNFATLTVRLGQEGFNTLLNQRLALETGLTVSQIQDLRATLPETITNSQFAIILLTANSIDAITPGGLVLQNDLFLQDRLIAALNLNNIPVSLIADRLELFQRSFSDSMSTNF